MMNIRLLHPVMRTTTPTIWQFTCNLNTSGGLTDKAKGVKVKKEKTTPSLTLAKVKLAFCSITESEDHKTIRKELDKCSLTDIMVGHILDLNIKVHKVALESNITVFREKLVSITRTDLTGNLAPGIKVGRFSIADDKVIKHNWNKLIEELNIKEEKVVQELFENTKRGKVLGIKKNIVGYFLSQGLSDVRLATDVFQRARLLLLLKKGHFTPEEDQIIIDFVEKEGNKWSKWEKLSLLMGRNTGTLMTRYEVLTLREDIQCGKFTADEDEMIIRDIFAVNKNILNDGKIENEDYQKIGNKLRRTLTSVRYHWKKQLEPMLKMHHAGTLTVDLKDVLINHLVEHNLDYAQEVDWKQLVQLPKFAGTTPAYLQLLLANLKKAAGQKYTELGQVELTTRVIQIYLDNSDRIQNKKKQEYQSKLIEFYVSNIL